MRHNEQYFRVLFKNFLRTPQVNTSPPWKTALYPLRKK